MFTFRKLFIVYMFIVYYMHLSSIYLSSPSYGWPNKNLKVSKAKQWVDRYILHLTYFLLIAQIFLADKILLLILQGNLDKCDTICRDISHTVFAC